MLAVPTVRSAAAAEASLAAILDLNKFGTAIAAMIRMIATTISSSINEKPFCFFIFCPLSKEFESLSHSSHIPISAGREANEGPTPFFKRSYIRYTIYLFLYQLVNKYNK